MSETTSVPTRKPRPAGPRQCPRCHRDLWEPCLQCRQTGLQGPGIVWCLECRQPGRGKYCRKCGTKLHTPPVCTRCHGQGWLSAHQVCLPELHAGSAPSSKEQPEHSAKTPDGFPTRVPKELDSQVIKCIFPRYPSASPRPVPEGADAAEEPSRLARVLRVVFLIILVILFFGYVSICGYTWY